MTREEFLNQAEQCNKEFHEAASKGWKELYALNLWQFLQLEKKVIAAMPDCEVKRQVLNHTILGTVFRNGVAVADFNVEPWPSVMLTTFCPNKAKYTEALIAQGAVTPFKGVHRILDWHGLIKEGFVQRLAKNQWVIHYPPMLKDETEVAELVKEFNIV